MVKKSAMMKYLLCSAFFSGGLILGDMYRPIQSLDEFVTYYQVGAEDGTPFDYKSAQTEIRVNEKGRAELYFGNGSVMYKVREDWRVGTFGEEVDVRFDQWKYQSKEYIYEKKESLKEKWERSGIEKKVKDWFD